MNTIVKAIGVVLISAGLVSASDLAPQLNELRTWTNAEGKSVRAICVGTDGERVRLVVLGQSYVYEVNRLSRADQSVAAELWRREQLKLQTRDTSPGYLRVGLYALAGPVREVPNYGHARA